MVQECIIEHAQQNSTGTSLIPYSVHFHAVITLTK